MPPTFTKGGFQRRVIGYHGYRLDGLTDLLCRAQDKSVFDVGCNRGMVAYEFVQYGATTAHGCDNYDLGMTVANEVFADWRNVNARFEVVDLSLGPVAIERAFGDSLLRHYDFMIFLAVYHKLKRVMAADKLSELVRWLADHCGLYFVWRGSCPEMNEIEPIVIDQGFRRIHLSEISELVVEWDGSGHRTNEGAVIQPAAVWRRS